MESAADTVIRDLRPMTHELFLHEEVFLLALSDEKGSILSGAWYQQAVGGAILSELLMAERVRIDKQGKKSMVEVLRTEPIGESLADEWLAKMAASPKAKTLGDWLSKISNTKDLKERVARRLVGIGILEEQSDKVLFVFNRTRYPEANSGPEQAIIERLRKAIFTDTSEVSPRDVALISIAKSTDVLSCIFDRRELKQAKQRIEALIAGDLTGKAVAELVQTMIVVITTACIVPIIVS